MRRVLALLLVAACGDRTLPGETATGDPSTGTSPASATTTAIPTTTTTSSTGDTPTTGAAPLACSCAAYFDHDGCGDDELWPQIADCELPTICPTVTVACPRPNQDIYSCEADLVIDAEALECAIVAMRDRTPGRFIVEGINNGGIFSAPPVFAVRLPGADQAATTSCQGTDTGTSWDAIASTLAEPSFFSDCLATPDAQARHDCALQGLLMHKSTLPLCGA